MGDRVDRDRLSRVAQAFLGWDGAWADELELVAGYLARLPDRDEFAYLPALLPDSHRLPIADMYVELQVSEGGSDPAPLLLSDRVVDDWIEERRRSRDMASLSVEEALDLSHHHRIVILGDPGGGKSSLLRRIARDVAHQKWRRWTIPMHVSLPEYWRDRQAYPDIVSNLFQYAAAMVPIRAGVVRVGTSARRDFLRRSGEAARGLAGFLSRDDSPPGVVFLLDGLDEIAGDPRAREQIWADLESFKDYHHSWIVASRRTGLFQHLGEGIRYQILDLDRDGIEQLVGNWFRSLPARLCADSEAASEAMLAELEGEPRLLSMARNPYLCMLLCHLRSVSEGPLPTNRAKLYERIIVAARDLLKARLPDPRNITRQDLDRLGNLCYHLYRGTPRHLFSSDDWEGLYGEPLDADSVYLQSRLVDQWGDSGSGYHLTHLTLHEYLVARHLAEHGFDAELAEHLHSPQWRMIWRFLAARLWGDDRKEEAVDIVRRLLTEIDLLGFVYVEAAHLLAEMEPREALALLEVDLEKKLIDLFLRGEHGMRTAGGTALAVLDPEYFLRIVRYLIKELRIRPGRSWDQLFQMVRDGGDAVTLVAALTAVGVLGRIHHPDAENLLLELFSTPDSDIHWAMATNAVVKIADSRLRQRMFELAARSKGRLNHQLAVIAEQSRHPDCLPYLLADVPTSEGEHFRSVCEALRRYKAPEAFSVLKQRWLQGGLDRDEADKLAGALIACCGFDEGRQWVMARLGDEVDADNELLWYFAIIDGLVADEHLLAVLRASPAGMAAKLIGQVGYRDGGTIGHDLWTGLRPFFDLRDENEVAVAFSTLAEIAAENTQVLTEDDVEWFAAIFATPGHPHRKDAAHVLTMLGPDWTPELIRAALEPGEELGVRYAILSGLRTLAPREPVRDEIAEALLVLLDEPNDDLAEAAARTIAALNVALLVPYQGHPDVHNTLVNYCSDRGTLIFRDRIVGGR